MADPECLFCAIVAGSVPADVVADTEHAIAFRDVNPAAPVHVLVIPRSHHANLAALASSGDTAVIQELFRLAGDVARSEDVAEGGYRLVANTGADAHQTVPHAHVHVLGGRQLGWPPG